MISHATSESQATIIHTDQGAWCCSACGGFVRQDARICKHCNRAFGQGGFETHPTVARLFLGLLGAGLIEVLFMIGGVLLAAYLRPSYGEMFLFGSPSLWLGVLAGMAIGSFFALMFMAVTLRSR